MSNVCRIFFSVRFWEKILAIYMVMKIGKYVYMPITMEYRYTLYIFNIHTYTLDTYILSEIQITNMMRMTIFFGMFSI